MSIHVLQEDEYPALPTLKQFCKSSAPEERSKAHVIEKVWFPNQYPSLSLETEGFRVRVHEKSAVFGEILNALYEWEETSMCIAIRITDEKTADYEIIELPSTDCLWESLGKTGRKLIIQEKPKSKAKRKRT